MTNQGPPRRNVAIFVDMENLFGGYNGDVGSVPIRQILSDVRNVASTLGVLSDVALTRAYANWSDSRLASYRREMMEHGVEPVQVFSFGRNVKNAADIELVVDALSRAFDSPWIDVFVIVSGDGGFVPLIRRLHALGRHVIVVTTQDTENRKNSKLLAAVADHYHVIGTSSDAAVEPVSAPLPLEPAVIASVGSHPTASEVMVQIRSLVERDPNILSNDGLAVNSALLGQRLHSAWPEMTVAKLGYKTLTKLAEEALNRPLRTMTGPGIIVSASGATPPAQAPSPSTMAVLTTRSPETVDEYRDIMLEVLAAPSVVEALEPQVSAEGYRLATFGHLFRRVAPNCHHEAAGFPTLKLALRYVLSSSIYCLVPGPQPSDLRLIKRELATEESVPDLSADDLETPQVVRELLAHVKPHPLRFDSREATTAVAVYLTADGEAPAGRIADLLEDVSDDYPGLSAETLRLALFLFVASGILVGDDDTPMGERLLSVHPAYRTYEEARRQLKVVAEQALDRFRWPVGDDVLEHLLPPGESRRGLERGVRRCCWSPGRPRPPQPRTRPTSPSSPARWPAPRSRRGPWRTRARRG